MSHVRLTRGSLVLMIYCVAAAGYVASVIFRLSMTTGGFFLTVAAVTGVLHYWSRRDFPRWRIYLMCVCAIVIVPGEVFMVITGTS